MNQISSLLNPGSVIADHSFTSKKKLFEHAAGLFEELKGLKRQEVFDSLFERERLGSTALGYGVAIPHGRIKGLGEAAGAFYRINPPLEFDSPDGLPIGLCFILLVPQNADDQHLQILGELAQMLGDAGMRERLMNCNPAQLFEYLTAWTP